MTNRAVMRRKEKLMTSEETITILEQGEYGHLATVGQDGYPYSVPLNYAYSEGSIYFHSAKTGHKVDNMRFSDMASFTVVGNYQVFPERFDTEYDSVVVFGKVSEVIIEEEVKKGLWMLINKYSRDYQDKGTEYVEKAWDKLSVFRLEIQEMTGKKGR